MWWFARPEEPPPGLPSKAYAIFKKTDGWYFVRTFHGYERHREGPFPEREDARWWAWKDAWDRGAAEKPA